ncbi:MAG TPA: carbohydrate ABC transporter permease [Spirochaetia bacterium]|nr:carbohydrate ABC transporter permease [Spirochaetia bacterium]
MARKDLKGISSGSNALLNVFFAIYSALCIAPLLLVVAVSFTDEKTVYREGYKYIPSKLSLAAYKFVFTNVDQVMHAYGVTILVTVVGTLASLLFTAMLAYVLSRKDFRYRKALAFYVFFTILFSGGFVPWYVICVRVLHIKDTLWALILPYLINGWYVIILRTFFASNIPDEILESARIDGAGELRTFFQIVTPLAIPGLATIGLFNVLTYWNDWWLPLTLINNDRLYNLQYLMYKVELDIQYLKMARQSMGALALKELMSIPSETSRMAMAVIAIGPIVLAYPFFQRYFVRGLTIGALKG